jgi:transcriptional regulator with XRE-family HTH domain
MASTLGDLIRAARVRKSWTQADLAREIGHSAGYIGQLESGMVQRPRPETLKKFEKALGLSREAMTRAIGMTGPESHVDVRSDLRLLLAIGDSGERAAAFRKAPPAVLETVDLALELARTLLRP